MLGFLYLGLNGAGLAFGLLIALYWLRRYGTAALATQPAVAFSLYFSMIHFIVPLYKYTSGHYRYPFEYAPITMLYNVLISIIICVLIAVLLRNPGRRYSSEKYRKAQPGSNLALLTGLVVTFAGLLSMFMVVRQMNDMGYHVFLSDRIRVSAQIGAFTRIDTIVLPGLALMLASILNRRGRNLIVWIVFIALTICASLYFALMQSRNSIILMYIILASVFFFYRSLSLRWTSSGVRTWAITLLLLILFGWFGYRTTAARYEGLESAYAHAALENLIFMMLDGPFGNDENLLWLIEFGHPYYWGQTYLAGLTNLVPRSIWPEKSWGAGPEIRNLIYPGSYVLGAEGNTSITTGFLTEARMNFGFLGIVFVGAIWVWVVRRLVHALLRARTVISQTMLIFLLCFLTTAFVYSEFLGFIARLFICVAAVAGVYLGLRSFMALTRVRHFSRKSVQ